MKESLKSLLLASLTGLLIVLVGVLWFEPAQGNATPKETEKVYPISDVSYLIDVEFVNIIADGDQIKTFFYDVADLFSRLKPQLAVSLLNLNDAEEIDVQAYYAARRSNSIEFCLNDRLSTTTLLSVLSNSDILFTPKVDHLKSIMISADGIVFFRGDDGYYTLKNQPIFTDITEYLDYLDIADDIVYSTVYEQFNIELSDAVRYDTLLPTAIETDFKPIAVNFETTADNESAVLLLANRVFGSRLNFVRRFFDVNNSIVMLYGYGEQALKVSTDGMLTVSNKINQRNATEANLLTDLKLAIDTIADYNLVADRLYLESVELIDKDGIAGYTFSFGYKINGYQVHSIAGFSGIQIDIVGGQVQLYKRLHKSYAQTLQTDEVVQTLPIFAIVNKQSNYDRIIANYINNHPDFLVDGRSFVKILASLENFKMLYIDTGDRLIPAYSFTVENVRYYFDATNFSLIEEEIS